MDYTTGSLVKTRSEIIVTYPQPIITRLRLPRNNKILNEADITSIKVYHKLKNRALSKLDHLIFQFRLYTNYFVKIPNENSKKCTL